MRRARGFTLVELTLGIVFTSMIGGAIAMFSLALSSQWRAAEASQHLDVSAQQGSATIGAIIQSSRRVGGVFNNGKPSIFLWKADSLGGHDSKAQFAEMSVIEFDPQLQSIFYYEPNAASNLLADLHAMQEITALQMLEHTFVDLFKTQNWLEQRHVLLGPGRAIAADVSVTRVRDARFATVEGQQGVQIEITLVRGEDLIELRDYYAVRNPADQSADKGVGF